MKLTIEMVGYFRTKPSIMKDYISHADITVVNPKVEGKYMLIPGQYLVAFAEEMVVPEGLHGIITALPELIRNGVTIHGRLVSDIPGQAISALLVVHNPMGLSTQKGAAIAELNYIQLKGPGETTE